MLILKLIVSTIVNLALLGGLLFLPAGTWAWWRAWVFLGVFVAGTVALLPRLLSERRDLLIERLKFPIQKGQPLADKILILPFIILFYGLIGFSPLDVFHLHLLGRPGLIVSFLGLALFIAGWWIISLALKENPFAAAVVKHQAERGQKIIDTGVYAVVRHPMYAGVIPLLIGMPLWLESYATACLALVPIGLLVLRIHIEEKLLRRELKGYEDYARRVRWRLIPFVW